MYIFKKRPQPTRRATVSEAERQAEATKTQVENQDDSDVVEAEKSESLDEVVKDDPKHTVILQRGPTL